MLIKVTAQSSALKKTSQRFVFQMHQSDIYPQPKEAGDLDINLKRGTGDDDFLKILKESLPKITKIAKPDIIFVVGGCDPLSGDPLAGLRMTPAGIVKRDEIDYRLHCEEKNSNRIYVGWWIQQRCLEVTNTKASRNILTKYNSKSRPAARKPI